MSKFLSYFKEVRAQRQINHLAKKYNNKKIVLYGAGEYAQVLMSNYDLSKLNIVGICDKKFEASRDLNTTHYKALIPEELKEYNYDVILTALYDDSSLCDFLEYNLLMYTKNEGKEVRSIIEPTFWYAVKVLLGK